MERTERLRLINASKKQQGGCSGKPNEKSSLRANHRILYYLEAIHGLIKDFMDEMKRQQMEAKKMNRPMPSLIRDVDDFMRPIELDLFIMGSMPKRAEPLSQRDEELNKALLQDPKFKELLIEKLRDQNAKLRYGH